MNISNEETFFNNISLVIKYGLAWSNLLLIPSDVFGFNYPNHILSSHNAQRMIPLFINNGKEKSF